MEHKLGAGVSLIGHIPGVHIPGTLIPIGAVAAMDAARTENDAALLLLLNSDADGMAADEGGTVVEYAILEFNREAIPPRASWTVVFGDDTYGPYASASEAEAKLAEIREQLRRGGQTDEAAILEAREQWLRTHVKVHSNVSEVLKPTMYRTETVYFDHVIVDGVTHKVDPGQGQALAVSLADEAFPIPTTTQATAAPALRKQSTEAVRTWRARWVTSTENSTVPKPDDLWWASIPTDWVVSELNRRAADGWKLVHVGVDHGMYAGLDAKLGGSPETIRYTLARDVADRNPQS